MDALAAQQSLRRHLQFLREMGFLYLEPEGRPQIGHAYEPPAEPATGGADGNPVPPGFAPAMVEYRSTTQAPAESPARSGAAVFGSERVPVALEWPASLFTRPSRTPLEVVNPPLESRGPGQTGSEEIPWDADELFAHPGAKAPREKPRAEELDLFAVMATDSAIGSEALEATPAPVNTAAAPAPPPSAGAEPETEPKAPLGQEPSPGTQGPPAPTLGLDERVERLSAIAREVAACRTCGLCESRTHVVPGQGNPMARVVFVGEGPGQTEDDQGLAFVGRAGQLLTDIIHAMELTRDDVFICNVVKCRPPGNRVPAPDEMAACEPFLKRQLEILRPDVIVALGGVALKCLLRDPKLSITRIRGSWQRYEGIPLMPTFHPAYLLRNPWDKPKVWEDIQKVMRVFGLEPKARA